MTNQEILRAALRQSAIDLGCAPSDLCSPESRVVPSVAHPQARRYLKLPFFCNLVSYGSCAVASVDPRVAGLVEEYIGHGPVERLFETPRIHLLTQAFADYGKTVCYMAEYFLPDVERIRPLACGYDLRVLEPQAFSGLYGQQWGNALCAKRKHLDRLAVGAYDAGQLIGLAGASADCDEMWQIGIDVLPSHRRRGVASALVSRLAVELLDRGVVPFYCAAWSNLGSVRSAIKSGFRPAWVELTAIDTKEAMEMA